MKLKEIKEQPKNEIKKERPLSQRKKKIGETGGRNGRTDSSTLSKKPAERSLVLF